MSFFDIDPNSISYYTNRTLKELKFVLPLKERELFDLKEARQKVNCDLNNLSWWHMPFRYFSLQKKDDVLLKRIFQCECELLAIETLIKQKTEVS